MHLEDEKNLVLLESTTKFMIFLPNIVVEPPKGVDVSVLGCVAVVLPKNNPLPVRV